MQLLSGVHKEPARAQFPTPIFLSNNSGCFGLGMPDWKLEAGHKRPRVAEIGLLESSATEKEF